MDQRPPRTSRSNPWQTPEKPTAPSFDRRAQRQREIRIFGAAACAAVVEDRFEAIRKAYVNRPRSREFGELLARLASARIGYKLCEDAELEKLTGSQHHEGIALDIERKPQPTLDELKRAWASAPRVLAIALCGVGNPHNVGAILRSAVHFGASAVLMPESGAVALSGAVYRVAEGAAERVAVACFASGESLRADGMTLIATAMSAEQVHFNALPAKSMLLLGAESAGLEPQYLALAHRRVRIPGTGRVDSLNVAQAATVLMAEWWRSTH
jgi:TrmH RNA methyltransferase